MVCVCYLSHGRSASCYDLAEQDSVWCNYLRNIRQPIASDNASQGGLCFPMICGVAVDGAQSSDKRTWLHFSLVA